MRGLSLDDRNGSEAPPHAALWRRPESADIAEANETDVHRLILSAAAPGRRSLGRGG